MAKKSNKFLNFIGLGSEEEYAQQDMYNEEDTPVANRRDAYNNRGYQQPANDNYGYENTYDNGYDAAPAYEDSYRDAQPQNTTYGASKIVNHPAAGARHRTMIYQLTSYEDSKDVIDDLLEKHSVLINLEALELKEAQRIIDTLIGACYAINATIKKAAAQTYLLAPECVEVAGTYADEGHDIFEE